MSARAGWGAGLMAFGQNLQNQFAETARQRRENSLLELRRQWQLEDEQNRQEFQMGLLDRQDATTDRRRGEDRDFARQDRAEAWERDDRIRAEGWDREDAVRADERAFTEPERASRIALTNAQTGRLQADAERLKAAMDMEGPASMDSLRRNPERFVPATVQRALEANDPSLAVPRDQGFRLIEARNRAIVEVMNNDVSLMNATPQERQAAFAAMLPAINEQFFMLYQGVIPEASLAPLLAYERPEQIEAAGDPAPDLGLLAQPSRVNPASFGQEVSRMARNLPANALQRALRPAASAVEFGRGLLGAEPDAPSGRAAGTSFDPLLIQDVAADLRSMSESQVRAELRAARFPEEEIDRIIAEARASQ